MNQTPKVEKKEFDLFQNQYGRISNRPMQCDDEIHLKVVNSEYVSQLGQEKQDLIDALKFECGNRCADQNPCNAKETLKKHGVEL